MVAVTVMRWEGEGEVVWIDYVDLSNIIINLFTFKTPPAVNDRQTTCRTNFLRQISTVRFQYTDQQWTSTTVYYYYLRQVSP